MILSISDPLHDAQPLSATIDSRCILLLEHHPLKVAYRHITQWCVFVRFQTARICIRERWRSGLKIRQCIIVVCHIT